jgi:thymidylate kinase
MKFIAITGPDASGKDTQIKRLEEHLRQTNLKTHALSIHSSMEDFHSISDLKTISSFLDIFILKFDPMARSLFLLSLLKNSLAKVPVHTDVVLYNSYWYKYAASEASYGIPLSFWIDHAADLFPTPDLVLNIQVTLENCLLRRSKWSAYESGEAQYFLGSPLNLKSFQTKMHQSLQQILSQSEQNSAVIDGSLNEDLVAASMAKAVQQSLGLG